MTPHTPVDTLESIVAEMRAAHIALPLNLRDWADRIEALAASAQVREVEACECHVSDCCPAHNRRIVTPTTKPAPEPVPVAQGDMAGRLEGLARALQRRGYPDNAKLIRAAIADHARIVASLEADNERLRGAFDDHDETASVHWYGEWVEQKRRAEQTEASLAACRAQESSLLLAYADRIEKAEPYLRNGTMLKWCQDIAADMRADAAAGGEK